MSPHGAPRPAGSGAEEAGIWLWDALFVGAGTVTAVLVAVSDQPVPERIAAAAIVLGIGIAWVPASRRLALTGEPGRPAALGYATAITAAIVAAGAMVPESAWALFAVLPQMFWVLRLPTAIAVTVVLTPGVPLLAGVANGNPLSDALREVLPQGILMTAFGVLVGLWIHRVTEESDERARLIAELEASRAEVAELSHQAGVTAERERLAGEIHDTLAQGFASIVALLQAAEAEIDADSAAARRHLALAVRTARENLQEARALVAATAPSELEMHGLADAIGRATSRFSEQTKVAAAFATDGTPRRLPAEHEVVLLRAAQELLANVAKHAGARRVRVRMEFTDLGADAAGTVALTVTDDGAGFDPAAVTGERFGLAMMRTRAERLGGTFDVDSAPGAGARITVRLPT